ncbi:hypothetical protein A2778_00820 [Candidatus Daviesbacteria bacterium RIFCSPHIGHO2_01_FULL_40_24]|uniref:J domain-containing protein n=1 Tax=Candidatus Daviesbacteria bacterium GW2011_GWC2_40_12 TaxID=1618431 RepID=A0A0G0TWU7_9BACT|nr:MAG: hypothetical protein UT45_C0004G0092 [Candidatus Daviesbacteria bacterium GW2011_GWA2_39_33]KKR42457.1 MAG: hypothetical protein UT77_C0002G0110 [Candidatus Daviesbacteria bacterium GW2011_GWC2_40_12]OGE22371.1 MAG: hypothetical protein A2778_00820 [Candidatus Daviesbacteria bacterium RIFCSPHIGHO2_01_FULL_40_24]OGE28458.1 MAG: hypothetical protein A3C29_05815 [Candidatus Daviesbacteria bacterium RIFCSPHIGHO2_02_FULL_40_16]OGE42089.1 MAG: hypothetical protein A3A53_04320 [Candidatus Davi
MGNILKKIDQKVFGKLFIILAVFLIGLGLGREYLSKNQNPNSYTQNTLNAFISEIYDKVKENYWNNISDAELLELFKLSIEKNNGNINVSKFEDKNNLLTGFSNATSGMNDEEKNKFTALVAASVLSSLTPVGRSGLYTQALEQQLKNKVENVNPGKDLYKDLGLQKGASEAAVKQAYQNKANELSGDKSPKSQEKLKSLSYARDTLTQKDTKEKYDQKGVEPTIFSRIEGSGILYVQFKKFSPTSLEEFKKTFEKYKDNTALTALIFDLRGNIGGAIDSSAYFLGYFLGKGQYAFDFYHKGEYIPFKTQTDKLPSAAKFKQVVVLIDQNTQSSAEMMAASFKRYHLGAVLGVPSKGWGTVERVFPLENQIRGSEKYSLFLVHSLTLRDDNQPIEGRGVEPDININDQNWPQKLFLYFNNPDLVETIKKVMSYKDSGFSGSYSLENPK